MALAVSGALLAGAWAGPAARSLAGAGDPRPVVRSSYVIRAGDTLWSIAERADPGADPRPLVDAIAAANGVDAGALVPGRVLVIPAGV